MPQTTNTAKYASSPHVAAAIAAANEAEKYAEEAAKGNGAYRREQYKLVVAASDTALEEAEAAIEANEKYWRSARAACFRADVAARRAYKAAL